MIILQNELQKILGPSGEPRLTSFIYLVNLLGRNDSFELRQDLKVVFK